MRKVVAVNTPGFQPRIESVRACPCPPPSSMWRTAGGLTRGDQLIRLGSTALGCDAGGSMMSLSKSCVLGRGLASFPVPYLPLGETCSSTSSLAGMPPYRPAHMHHGGRRHGRLGPGQALGWPTAYISEGNLANYLAHPAGSV